MIFDLAEQSVASLLGITQQHGSIGFVKNRIVYGGVTDTHRTLHDDDLLGQPHFQDGHACDDGIGIFFSGTVDSVVGSNDEYQVGFLFPEEKTKLNLKS
jgi:hypothetical protein